MVKNHEQARAENYNYVPFLLPTPRTTQTKQTATSIVPWPDSCRMQSQEQPSALKRAPMSNAAV